MQKFNSVDELINNLKPVEPVYCVRPSSIKSASTFFKKNFSGLILYAVKTNPHPRVLKELINSGITNFDVASIEEIKTISDMSQSVNCYYMNTIKNKDHIRQAYFNYKIKSFALDTKDELLKIINATENAKDLNLFIRVSISNEHAEIDLSKKFGALTSEVLGLLRLAKENWFKFSCWLTMYASCILH